MNREIKFRVWDIEEKSWLDRTHAWHLFYDKFLDMNNGVGLNFQQFTGLKDKNGVEIYEGDIVNGHYFGFNGNETDNLFTNGEVMYSDWAQYGIQTKDGWLDFDQTSHFEEPCLEVVGNIFENSDLLK